MEHIALLKCRDEVTANYVVNLLGFEEYTSLRLLKLLDESQTKIVSNTMISQFSNMYVFDDRSWLTLDHLPGYLYKVKQWGEEDTLNIV
jgi:hypothetical protein